jgi:hypothetical protein
MVYFIHLVKAGDTLVLKGNEELKPGSHVIIKF